MSLAPFVGPRASRLRKAAPSEPQSTEFHARSYPEAFIAAWIVLTQYTCARILCSVNLTLSIDEQIVSQARKRAGALGKSLNQLIRDYLERLAGGDDPDRSIEEFRSLSGRGHSRGWRFNRDEIHNRQDS